MGPPGSPPPSMRGSGVPSPPSAEKERVSLEMVALMAEKQADAGALARAEAAEGAKVLQQVEQIMKAEPAEKR